MSDSREQFEACFPLPEHVRWDGEQYLCDSRYQIRAFLTYYEQWDVWQASRQALVVELPIPDSHSPDPLYICAFGQSCREAIEAASVRVKV